MPMGKGAGRSPLDYKKPFNSKPGQGKMGYSSQSKMLPHGRNSGQKNHLEIPQDHAPAPGSPTPTQAPVGATGKNSRNMPGY